MGLGDFFGPGYFFHSRHDPVFLFVYNTIHTIEFFFQANYGPGF